MNKAISRLMLRWSICIVLAALCLTVGFVAFLRPSAIAPFMVLSQPRRTPGSLRDWVEGWLPTKPAWAWARRLELALFGQRKPLQFDFVIVSLAQPPGPGPSSLPLGTPIFSDTNGVQAWVLGPGDLKAIHARLIQARGLNVLYRPRFTTADGIDNRMFAGQYIPLNGSTNSVGMSVGCWARVHPAATDLIASIVLSELVTNEATADDGAARVPAVSIRTNMDMAFRFQIPKGNGMFVLDKPSPADRSKHIGVLLDPP